MKKHFCLLLLILPLSAFGQTQISGVVNRYAAVNDINYCTTALTVSDPSHFSPGDRVLLIQMKGAVINSSNTSSFGAVSQMVSAGKYEWATVQSITGNEVSLQFALVNTYDLNGSIQLVYVPQYTTATVTGLLTAPAWNGSTGGVIAVDVQFVLYLQADVDVSGKGFRGGEANSTSSNSCNWLTPQSDYSYSLNNWRGAGKGEGIAYFLSGSEAGRGSQANGGGGGNDHNAGGGGGGHLSVGGRGGANEEPSTFGCSGQFPGLGGRAISLDGTRLIMGGGGGAGHGNNDLGTDGGHGGGIIILKAIFINGNGFSVRANGLAAANSLSDGAGGGGAGGAIILPNSISVNNLTLEAKGGRGGDANNGNGPRCMGPGGGGSGGRINTSGLFPPTQMIVTPGQNGVSINSTACSTGPNGAQSGQPGQTNGTMFAHAEGNIPAGTPTFTQQPLNVSVCPGDSVVLTANVSGSVSGLQWQLNNGAGWINLVNNSTYTGAQNDTLIIRNISAAMSGFSYSLRASSLCFPDAASQPAVLTVFDPPSASFTSSVNGNTATFSNTSSAGNSFVWNFGDSQSDTSASPAHTYALPGTYTVQLITANACGADTATASVVVIALPQAAFTANMTNGCAPLTVGFNSAASSSALTYLWSFPGGQPAASNQAAPTVTYPTSGVYDVRLIVGNASGFDTLLLPQYVTVSAAPTAVFSAQAAGGFGYNFTNNSQGAVSYLWNFGDGATSTASQPSHTYAMPGFYTVTLTTTNTCGSAQFMVNITVGQAPAAAFGQSLTEGCAPMAVQYNDQSTGVYTARQWQFPGGTPATSTQPSQLVIYTLPGTYSATLQLSGPLGTSAFTQPNAVTAYPYPQPAFTFVVQGSTVTFTNNSMNAVSYSWLFGDGNSSQAAAPTHTYAAPGVYTVTLNAQRPFCAASTSMTVVVGTTSSGEASAAGEWRVFPNPVSDRLMLQRPTADHGKYHYLLWNISGLKVLEGVLEGTTEALDLQTLPAGMYWLELAGENGLRQRVKVLIIHP